MSNAVAIINDAVNSMAAGETRVLHIHADKTNYRAANGRAPKPFYLPFRWAGKPEPAPRRDSGDSGAAGWRSNSLGGFS